MQFFVTESKVLVRRQPKGNKIRYEKSLPRQTISWPRSEPRISLTRNRNANYSMATFVTEQCQLNPVQYVLDNRSANWVTRQMSVTVYPSLLPYIHHCYHKSITIKEDTSQFSTIKKSKSVKMVVKNRAYK